MGIFFPLIYVLVLADVVSSVKFTFVNKCDQTVWPRILSDAEFELFQPTGFALHKGESKVVTLPSSWGGRFWGRTFCSQDSDGKFTCVTGDCGSGKTACATPLATLAQFTLDGDGGMDSFHLSLVGGYNLPLKVSPSGGSGHNCTSTECTVDLNERCPLALKLMNSDGKVVACKSACVGQQEDCCRNAYGSRKTCKPPFFSQVFKTACAHASTYAYDDESNTFTCTRADYHVTFCPPSSNKKKSKEEHQTPATGNSITAPHRSTHVGKVIGISSGIISVTLLVGLFGIKYKSIRTQNINILNGSCNCC